MRSDDVPVSKSRVAVLSVLVLVAFGVLIALGTWQLERKSWKEGLIDTIAQRLAAPASALPPRQNWNSLDAADAEFRRVGFRGTFAYKEEALVYTNGSALRADVSGPGYWVLTPVRLPDGSSVVVNRGFVPEGRQARTSRAAGELAGPTEIIGIMRWPDVGNWFTPPADPARNLWFARDLPAIVAVKKWGAVAPFYVEQEAPSPPGGLPQVGALRPNLPNSHLQYALTWYGLAAVLIGVFAAFARGEWMRRVN
ncbi:MAG TPA: SURF1 family protein [Xanthobacteraceae bacterium]|jgi:surfeit locus 1 family protein|nr:SURF1 family protein [Xanthobacteraceae bacterium]